MKTELEIANERILELENQVKKLSSNSVLAYSKIYHRGKELDYETAKKVIDEFPEEDDYVQVHYQQFLRSGEQKTYESSEMAKPDVKEKSNLFPNMPGVESYKMKVKIRNVKDFIPKSFD